MELAIGFAPHEDFIIAHERVGKIARARRLGGVTHPMPAPGENRIELFPEELIVFVRARR